MGLRDRPVIIYLIAKVILRFYLRRLRISEIVHR